MATEIKREIAIDWENIKLENINDVIVKVLMR